MKNEILINKKLSLRIPKPEEAQDIFNVIDSDREHLGEWLEWVKKTESYKDTENNISERIKEFNSKESAAFILYYENKPIGSVGFISLDHKNPQGEIGYWVSSSYAGKGYMTEAVKAVVTYGFNDLNLHRIVIKCASKNEKSAAIPKRLGFKLEGTLREERVVKGEYCDSLIFGLLKSDGSI